MYLKTGQPFADNGASPSGSTLSKLHSPLRNL